MTNMEQILQEVIGMSHENADALITSNELYCRLVAEDGVDFIITEDLRTDRVNLTVDSGKVTKAEVY